MCTNIACGVFIYKVVYLHHACVNPRAFIEQLVWNQGVAVKPRMALLLNNPVSSANFLKFIQPHTGSRCLLAFIKGER